MLSCKEVTHLLSDAQDRKLSLTERMALEIHLAICRGCSNYRKQIDFLRSACNRFLQRQEADGRAPPD